jgi:hypothetical protein
MNTPAWHAAESSHWLLALAGGLGLFGMFVWFGGHDPVEAWRCCSSAPSATPSRGRTRCSAPRR